MAEGDLFAIMEFTPDDGIAGLEEHLARLTAAAAARGATFDRHAARNELQAATFRLDEVRVVRLALSPSGGIAIETRSPAHRQFTWGGTKD